MGSNYFRFKQFEVLQDNVSMRVNTDGVLLGAWFSLPENQRPKVLDVGGGTGVIALMAAQRLGSLGWEDYSVEAVEIDFPSAVEAEKNFLASVWKKKLKSFHSDFAVFEAPEHSYDVIVSNPPYFINSLKNPSELKKTARHTDSLPYEELVCKAQSLLSETGVLAVILPYEESFVFKGIAEGAGFRAVRSCRVYAKTGDTCPKRIMTEYGRFSLAPKKEDALCSTLCIMEENLEYTPEYKSLTKDFYLKF